MSIASLIVLESKPAADILTLNVYFLKKQQLITYPIKRQNAGIPYID